MNNKRITDISPPDASSDFNKNKNERAFERTDVWSLSKSKSRARFFSRIKEPNKKRFLISASVFTAITIAVFVFLSFSGVEVKVWPSLSSEKLQHELTVDISFPEPDFSQGIIPGKFLEEEGELSRQFNSSGTVLKETRAEGVIHVYNNYHLGQTLVATTRFLSSDGKLFRSKKQVYIPAGDSVDVEVRAVEPGNEYNIGTSTFSVPGLVGSPRYTAVFGKSFSAMKGGERSQMPKITESDLKGAERVLKEELTSRLREKLKVLADSSSFVLLAETVSEEIVESGELSPQQTEKEQFNYTLRMRCRGLVFKKQDAQNLAKDLILKNLAEDKRIAPDTLKIEHNIRSLNLDSGKIVLEMDVQSKIYSELNITKLKNMLLGKSFNDGQRILTQDERIFTAQVKTLPFWKRKFPKNIEKIEMNIMLQEAEAID